MADTTTQGANLAPAPRISDMRTGLTAERLRELLDYDQETGIFTWLVTRGKGLRGTIAGSAKEDGYVMIRIDRRRYRAHRLAWLHVTGEWPEEEIDHVNRQRADNRFVNLRQATRSEQQQNVLLQSTNKSGYRGVSWHERDKRWQAQIHANCKATSLGNFHTPEEAYAAYCAAAASMHTTNPFVKSIQQ